MADNPVPGLNRGPAVWRDAWARLEADDDLLTEIANSNHPAARRLTRWLCHDLLPTLVGLCREPGDYEWPGSQGEFDAMVEAAISAVRPVQ